MQTDIAAIQPDHRTRTIALLTRHTDYLSSEARRRLHKIVMELALARMEERQIKEGR